MIEEMCDVHDSLEKVKKEEFVDPNGSFPPSNLLLTVRLDCKNLGATPIASNGLKPVRSDSREQIYLKIIWCE